MKLSRMLFFSLPALIVVLVCIVPAVSAQTVTFTGTTPLVNFGNVNLCAAGHTTPAPCTTAMTLSYNVTEGGTLGPINLVTGASPSTEFTLASGSTCTGSVTAGETCSVKVNFAPKYPGDRPGAVLLTDSSGNVVTETPMHGFGVGPQIGFDQGTLISLTSPLLSAYGYQQVAVDGAGNSFICGTNSTGGSVLIELPADGSPAVQRFSPGSDFDILGSAVDAAGDISVSVFSSLLYEEDGFGYYFFVLPAGGGPAVGPRGTSFIDNFFGPAGDDAGDLFLEGSVALQPGNYGYEAVKFGDKSFAFTNADPYGLAADGAGDLFVIGMPNPASESFGVFEIPAGSVTPTVLPITGLMQPVGLAVDPIGDVFLDDTLETADVHVIELPIGGGPQVTLDNHGLSFQAVSPAGDVFGTIGSLLSVFPVPGELQRSAALPLKFGTVAVGSSSTLTLPVINTGTGTLTVTPSLSSSSYQISSLSPENCLAGITANQTCTVEVKFAPTTPGTQNASLILETNGARNSTVSLEGTATGSNAAINFSMGFAGATGLQLNGRSEINGSKLQLTNATEFEAASVFYETPVNVRSFVTNFTFQLTDPNADGITFTLQNEGLKALGGFGGALGYAGINNSVAIKFDLHNNAGEGDNSTGLYLSGAEPTYPGNIDLTGSGIDLHSGHIFNGYLSYDGTNLILTINDLQTKAAFTRFFPINIPSVVGGNTAYAGFTAGTGAETATQEILSWGYVLGAP